MIHEIQRPFVDKPGTFTYRYGSGSEILPNDKVIVFIPGGPGQTAIDMSIGLPSEYKLVRIDPRGVGCNENSELTKADFNSEVLAKDVLAVVRDLKLKNYMLQGISYGTIVATMAAAMAEGEKTQAPSAVVLEGIIGRAYQPNEYLKGYLQAWSRVKPHLPQDVQKQLAQKPLPFDLTSEQWAAWLSSALIYGFLPGSDEYIISELSNLSNDADEDRRRFFKNRLMRTVSPSTEAKTKLYREITCREFVPDVRDVKFDFDLVAGELVGTDKNLCQGMTLDRPYDSTKYQIKVPVFYFSGELDPVTPPIQAEWHFNSQQGPKTFVSVEKGGHQALSANLSDCSNDLWRAIADQDKAAFAKTLATCSLKTKLK